MFHVFGGFMLLLFGLFFYVVSAWHEPLFFFRFFLLSLVCFFCNLSIGLTKRLKACLEFLWERGVLKQIPSFFMCLELL